MTRDEEIEQAVARALERQRNVDFRDVAWWLGGLVVIVLACAYQTSGDRLMS
jgi:hypothetical protein